MVLYLKFLRNILIPTQYKLYYSISENIIPIYTEFKGWKKEVSNIESFEDLPIELKEYISFIEKKVEVPINRLSVGPDRNQTIDL